ncbi:MAG: hypothetical protein U5L72_19705, partial [Bacteroidales bacterium]|nr:hypothetical protein [Bacteroidales bacterium]
WRQTADQSEVFGYRCSEKKRSTYIHFSLGEALELVQEVSPRKAYITHIGHQMGKHAEVNRELPVNVTLAWDGLEVACED